MKTLLNLFICLSTSIATAACAATARITIKVVEEDTGKQVVGIPVYATSSLSSRWVGRAALFEDKNDQQCVKTNQAGEAFFSSIECPSGEVGFAVSYFKDTDKKSMRDAGYYDTDGVQYKGTSDVLGKWQPWNPTLTVKLKRIINPIALYAKRVETQIPEYNKPCGYDLMKGDWVAPYGKGVTSDLVFLIGKDGKKIKKKTNTVNRDEEEVTVYDCTFSIKFPNDGDGIQSAYAKYVGDGELRLPRMAPEEGYQPDRVERWYWDEVAGRDRFDNQEHAPYKCPQNGDQNYYFRVRTEKKDGAIMITSYGKIYDDFQWDWNRNLTFTYYLNATPNDRNTEFDPNKNLFGPVSHRAGDDQSTNVRAP